MVNSKDIKRRKEMRKQNLFLLLILSVSTLMMAIPASADEITITFDEGRVAEGEQLTDQYSSLGVEFSPGAKVIDTDLSPFSKDLGFYNPTNDTTTLTFSPYVSSVSIDFKYAFTGNMDAILVNGNVLSASETRWLCQWPTESRLKIVSSGEPIKSIELSEGVHCVNWITFDDLTYTQIPEFPTIAIPVAAVLGLMFIIQRKKN